MATEYIHGFTASEQQRLTLMQSILNERQLQTFDLNGVRRVLDVGSGLGQMSRVIARQLGNDGKVIGIERSPVQLAEARRQASMDDEESLVEFREGDATDLPLSGEEFGSFDLVHARFLLEHVPDPPAVVRQMVRAARPGGQICLMDDDHDLLRLHPECPPLEKAWKVYWQSYRAIGHDPLIGRKLVELVQDAGAKVRTVDSLFYGAVAGQPLFDAVVDNLLGVISSARELLEERQLLTADGLEQAFQAAGSWRSLPSATVWYSLPMVVAVRPRETGVSDTRETTGIRD